MNIPSEIELKKFNGNYNKCLIEINKRLLKDQNGSYEWFIPIEVYSKINNSDISDNSDNVLLKDYYNRGYRWFVPKSKNKEQ